MADYQSPYLSQTNPYLQSQVDAAQGDIMRNWNTKVQPSYNSAMVKSGSFGNEGVNQMNQNAALDTQNALGRVSDSMRSQAYDQGIQNYQWDQGFNRSLYNDAYSQNMNNLSTGVGLLGSLNGYNQNDLTNANTIQNTPMNYWNNFANSANAIGNGFGTNTQRTGSTSNPLMGALGGAQLGQAAMGWWNQNNGTYSGAAPTYGQDGSNFGSNLTNQTGTYNTGSFYG